MENYIPPFDITSEMLELCSTIMEKMGRLSNVKTLEKTPLLRKVSRVKSIHSSLAIENNTLTLEQATAIINGKRVLGPEEDIIAIKNAFETYKMLDTIDAYNIKDMLTAHKTMMNSLVSENGALRTISVGVYSKGKVIHTAPPAKMVPELMYDLFNWAKNSDLHMLIKSSVFHYEFEFIHPFRDGNGRIGRFWQTALLSSWKPIFKYIPVENAIRKNQDDYYQAINQSTLDGKSNAFIVYMLKTILSAVNEIEVESANHLNHISIQVNKLMKVIQDYPLPITELMEKLHLKSRSAFRNNYLIPALEAGLIEMTEPNKPTSRNQMYYKK